MPRLPWSAPVPSLSSAHIPSAAAVNRVVELVHVLERSFSRVRPNVAIVAPIGLFILLDGVAQVVIRWIWGAGQSLFLWEWSAWVIPIVAFMAAYVVAVVAIASQMRRLGWWRLLDSNRSLDAIRALSWRDFERLVAGAFAEQGWSAELVGQDGPDGGTDLFLRKGKQSAIVQCKQRRLPRGYVQVPGGRQFVRPISPGRIIAGSFVSSGAFSSRGP